MLVGKVMNIEKILEKAVNGVMNRGYELQQGFRVVCGDFRIVGRPIIIYNVGFEGFVRPFFALPEIFLLYKHSGLIKTGFPTAFPRGSVAF